MDDVIHGSHRPAPPHTTSRGIKSMRTCRSTTLFAATSIFQHPARSTSTKLPRLRHPLFPFLHDLGRRATANFPAPQRHLSRAVQGDGLPARHASVNFLALLGWSLDVKPPSPHRRAVREFSSTASPARTPSSGQSQTDWMNSEIIQNMGAAAWVDAAAPFS